MRLPIPGCKRPRPVLSSNQVERSEDALSQFAATGVTTVLFKADLATSGRHQRRLSTTGLPDRDRRWLAGQWKRGHTAVLEPELDRILDISFLWDLSGIPKPFLGWTRPQVTTGRRYSGTRLQRPFGDCSAELKRFLLADNCDKLNATTAWLERHVIATLRKQGFRHLCGVDALVHRVPSGDLKIHPCVEVNPRCTMGHVALALRKNIAASAQAEFCIYTRGEWEHIVKEHGIQRLETTSTGQWQRGLVPLTEVNEQTKLVAVVHVA